jgi:hypothetical protein
MKPIARTRFVLLVAALSLAANVAVAAENDTLQIHEWGTFTCLQNDKGKELTGINIDDEPVPDFVHNLAPFILSQPVLTDRHWQYRMKGAPRHHPQVTMRLETPVIYFYPPKGQSKPKSVDVNVQFRGGWLTEFYPEAKADAPGLRDGGFAFRDLTPKTTGSLAWENVQVGAEGAGPETTENVWLAPRKVSAANVTAASGESERYLFYRGVGHIRAPLRLARGMERNEIEVFGNFDEVLGENERATIPRAWLVEVLGDGKARFRKVAPLEVTGDSEMRVGGLRTDSLEEPHGNLAALRQDMHAALVEEGLFADEATAMLATWDRAYFQSPGLRLFFIVPRPWVDHYLPLEVSEKADVERVMMARIELVTEDQKALLERLAQTASSDPDWVRTLPDTPETERFFAGRADFGDLGGAIPPDYQMYLKLGRFRNALVIAEEKTHPTENLSRFIENYALAPFRAPPPDNAERKAIE